MAVGCCAKCSKFFLIFFNLFFWLSGCALLFLGAWLLIDPSRSLLSNIIILDTGEAIIQYLAYGLLGIGSLVIVVGFCGCCGAIKESKCMLISYFFFLFIILAGELGIGIYAAINQEKVVEDIRSGLKTRLQDDYGVADHDAFTQSVDYAQFYFKCCGVDGPNDYNNSEWRTENFGNGNVVSQTCCILSNADDSDAYKNPEPKNSTLCQSPNFQVNEMYRHQKGCQQKLMDWFKFQNLILIGIGCGVPALEIFGMIITICLCVNIGEEEVA